MAYRRLATSTWAYNHHRIPLPRRNRLLHQLIRLLVRLILTLEPYPPAASTAIKQHPLGGTKMLLKMRNVRALILAGDN